MDHTAFIRHVQHEAGVPRPDAERAVRATLQTLGERISPAEASDIAAQLPREVSPALRDAGGPQPFDVQEFLRRMADRCGVTAGPVAEGRALAVFAALGSAITPAELGDLASELPEDFERLLAAARARRAQVRTPE
jgi:uncharacterized protein (DUF2267 family)